MTTENVRLAIIVLALGLAVSACEKRQPKTQKGEMEKEVSMGTTIKWLGHAGFRIQDGDAVVYIDPWKLDEAAHDATVVLVSHSHYDHYSTQDIARASGPAAKILASADVIKKEGKGRTIEPGHTVTTGDVSITGVASYNPNKRFHPKANEWLGFLVEVGGKRIYYAGDTDVTDEMKALANIDLALLPVGGTYTMSANEAARATEYIKPGRAIPYHWGDIVGERKDADEFAEKAKCEVTVLNPGQMLTLE